MNHPFKEPEEDAQSCLLVVCVCLNFLVWPWVWVFNMSGFLLPLGKAGAFVHYSLIWQVDWICANGWWNAFEIFFFPLCCRWVGAPTHMSRYCFTWEKNCHRFVTSQLFLRGSEFPQTDAFLFMIKPLLKLFLRRTKWKATEGTSILTRTSSLLLLIFWGVVLRFYNTFKMGNLGSNILKAVQKSCSLEVCELRSMSMIIELLEMQIHFNGICRQWPQQEKEDPPVKAMSMCRELWVIIALQADKDPLNLCKLFSLFSLD